MAYTIQSGDTLSEIAAANNTTVEAIASANNISNVNEIQAGASLNIPNNNSGGGNVVTNTISNVASGVSNAVSGISNDIYMGANKLFRSDEEFLEWATENNLDGEGYLKRTADTSKIMKAVQAGDPSSLKDADGNWLDPSYENRYNHMINTGKDTDGTSMSELSEVTGLDVDGVGETQQTITEQVLKWATDTGVIKSQDDMNAIIENPTKWMEDNNFSLTDKVPTLDADAEGTTISMEDTNTEESVSLDATTVDSTATVDEVDKPDVTNYTVKSASEGMTDSMMVDAKTKVMSEEGLVDVDTLTIDVDAAAAGESAVGKAINDWAAQDFTNIIDTSTPSGRELAKQLGEGNYLDKRATTAGQIEILSKQFINDQGEYVIPIWARGLAKSVSGSLNISGAAADAAMSQAIMASVIQIADKDAQFFQTLTTKNLDNRQQAIINKATVLANFETANLNARQAAAVTNAQNFLKLDIANLTNEQQAEVVNKQARIQALFDDTAAINAQRLFGAQNANEFAKFFSNLNATIQQHNSSEINALSKFNAGEINDAAQFLLEINNSRDQFLDQLQFNYDQFNGKWRQEVTLEQFKTEWDAVTQDVKNGLGLTTEVQNRVWDSVDSLLDYVFKYSQNENDAIKDLTIAQIQAQAGRKKGSGFLSGLFSLAGSFLSTAKGAEWLISLSDSRLKENIKKYNSINGVDLYTWEWSKEAKKHGADKLPNYGVVAQELYKTHPEAVYEKNGYLHVNYEVVKNAIR